MSSAINEVIRYCKDLDKKADTLKEDTLVSMGEGLRNQILSEELYTISRDIQKLIVDNV